MSARAPRIVSASGNNQHQHRVASILSGALACARGRRPGPAGPPASGIRHVLRGFQFQRERARERERETHRRAHINELTPPWSTVDVRSDPTVPVLSEARQRVLIWAMHLGQADIPFASSSRRTNTFCWLGHVLYGWTTSVFHRKHLYWEVLGYKTGGSRPRSIGQT